MPLSGNVRVQINLRIPVTADVPVYPIHTLTPIHMLTAIIILFAVAAVLGITVAVSIITKNPATPKPAVYAHGLFAATALVLLIIYTMNNETSGTQLSLIIFVIAALGGFILFYNDLKKKPGPVGLVVVHALAAVTAFVLLLIYALF